MRELYAKMRDIIIEARDGIITVAEASAELLGIIDKIELFQRIERERYEPTIFVVDDRAGLTVEKFSKALALLSQSLPTTSQAAENFERVARAFRSNRIQCNFTPEFDTVPREAFSATDAMENLKQCLVDETVRDREEREYERRDWSLARPKTDWLLSHPKARTGRGLIQRNRQSPRWGAGRWKAKT